MSDRELVLELARRLGLKETSHKQYKEQIGLRPDQYVCTDESIIFGEGEGYGGFVVAFCFREDDPDKLANHSCWE